MDLSSLVSPAVVHKSILAAWAGSDRTKDPWGLIYYIYDGVAVAVCEELFEGTENMSDFLKVVRPSVL